MSGEKPIGILGGTFDPVHYGHLRAALEVQEELGLAQIRFIPSRQPPHRNQPNASPAQRLTMLQQAVAGQADFIVDERELHRDGPSFMADTLLSLRAELGTRSLCLLLGMDAFGDLHHWHRWREISDTAHIVVLYRPNYDLTHSDALGGLVTQRRVRDPQMLNEQPAGYVLFQPITQLAISATRIRELLAQGRCPRYLMPDSVWHTIRDQGLYRSLID
ncbi:MAG: nicotinate-nucleotide adenylyltransferase [Candidatus Competibacteraceae bacterium]|jgi:nicotinate-nucleotide adenylyltransferase|nr:nicotinate-nucleotide adenylyltransferase [Candidatus Competibacteraceae bacterium]